MKKQRIVLQDCPECGRANVVGEYVHTLGDKALGGGMGLGAGILIASLFNPVLGVAAGVAAYKGFRKLAEHDDSVYGPVKYRFACPNPNCKHIWYDEINVSD